MHVCFHVHSYVFTRSNWYPKSGECRKKPLLRGFPSHNFSPCMRGENNVWDEYACIHCYVQGKFALPGVFELVH